MIYGYARVSAKTQLKGNSLEEQRTELERNGCKVIVEEQFSGKTTVRPKFDKLVKHQLQHGDTLIVTKLDRFARNVTEGISTIRYLFDKGVKVHVLNVGLLENTAMPDTGCTHITSPSDAAKYMMSRLRYETHEKFYVMMLNTKNRVIRVKQISEGSLSSAKVSPQCVYSAAVTAHSSAIIVFHNHPSKITNKSYEDLNLTNALVAAGEVLSIKMLDHIIIGGENFYSFREHGDIN